MQNTFAVQFSRAGNAVPIATFYPGNGAKAGIVFARETSAWPRGIKCRLYRSAVVTIKRPTGTRTTTRRKFACELEIREGKNALLCTVVSPPLPTGTYFFELSVGGMKFKKKNTQRVNLTSKQIPVLRFEERTKKQGLNLLCDVSKFSKQWLSILRASKIDGQSGTDWVADPANSDRRRACLINILAKLSTVPTAKDPLIQYVEDVFLADMDRIYVKVQRQFLDSLANTSKFQKDPQVHQAHHKLVGRIPVSRQRNIKDLVSYREKKNPSLQIVVSQPPGKGRYGTWYADIDIDLGNPILDVKGFFTHKGELVHPGRTNHLNLR